MTYLEKMKEAPNDFERSKVVEGYTIEFAAIMSAAGLEPRVGRVPTANGMAWVSYTNIPAMELIDIIAAISTADPELGDRASELHGDILNCANFSTALERDTDGPRLKAPTKEQIAAVLEPDPDADTATWLCPDPILLGDLEGAAALITPLEQLHKGKVDHIADITVTDTSGTARKDHDLVVTLIHRDEEDRVIAVTGYIAIALADFRKTYLHIDPATVEEVAEREYNPKWGYFHQARMKLSRRAYVLLTYATYGNVDYLVENHPAWQDAVENVNDEEANNQAEFEPSPSTIELDEDSNVTGNVTGNVTDEQDPAYPPRDELEQLCRQLFAVKQEKKDTDADFNETIKSLENDIRAMLHQRDSDRYQNRLPLEAVPDEEAEKALDAAAEESQETAPGAPQTAPEEETPASAEDSEPEAQPPEESAAQPETPEPEESTDPKGQPAFFPPCQACEGHSTLPGAEGCELCAGEGIEPTVRESDDDGLLLCARCGELRSFWAFLKYDGGRKGHICNVCRKV